MHPDTPDAMHFRYAWAESVEAFCFTLVEGLTVAEAVAMFPPTHAQRVGYAELGDLAYDVWDGDDAGRVCVGGVTVLGASGWLLVVEINGYGGTLPEVARALARRGYVMSFSTNVNALMTIDGTTPGEAADTVVVRPAVVERVRIETPTPTLSASEVGPACARQGCSSTTNSTFSTSRSRITAPWSPDAWRSASSPPASPSPSRTCATRRSTSSASRCDRHSTAFVTVRAE